MLGARKRSRCGERLVILDNNSGARRRPAARECGRRYGARVEIGLLNTLYVKRRVAVAGFGFLRLSLAVTLPLRKHKLDLIVYKRAPSMGTCQR